MSLLTLDNDVLVELLTFAPDLNTLNALILTHPAIHHAFAPRRRQILRHVFRNQTYTKSSRRVTSNELRAAHNYMSSIKDKKHMNPIDGVALRESLWPGIKTVFPGVMVPRWGISLQIAYRRAGLDEDAIAFARDAAQLPLDRCKWTFAPTLQFFGGAIKTMVKANSVQEATDLTARVLEYLQHRDPEHSKWAGDLAAKYILLGDLARARQFQLDMWSEYASILGPEHTTTLSWARLLVRDYQADHQHERALQFHNRVREQLLPSRATYIAWSRQTVQMARKLKKDAEALDIIENVRSHLGPGASGYYAWTKDLIEAYEKMGRNDRAISVCENAHEMNGFWSSKNPNDSIWLYKFKLSKLLLVKVYRKHGRGEDAARIEETCKEIDIVFG